MNDYIYMVHCLKNMVAEGKIKKEIAEKEIRIYEFLATCDQEDIYIMADCCVFNDVIKGYILTALQYAKLSQDDIIKAYGRLSWAFDDKTAEEAVKVLEVWRRDN